MQTKFAAGKNGDRVADICDHNFSELYAAIPSVGLVYYLDPTNGTDAGTGAYGDPVKTLDEGYALLRDGYNDVLIYIPGASGLTLAASFEWKKSYAHFIGACTPIPFSPRARIFLSASAVAQTYLFKVSGSGCVMQNLLIFMGVADSTAAYAGIVSGGRNWFRNVHFAGIGDATMDVAGAGSLLIDGGAENLFEDCTIGLDTIARAQNSRELVFDSAATRNTFKNCLFDAYISNAGHALVKIADGQGIDRLTRFIHCHFVADSLNHAVALTSVFDIPAGIAQGMIDLDAASHVSSWGSAASWDSNARGIISSAMVAPTAAGAGGISTHK